MKDEETVNAVEAFGMLADAMRFDQDQKRRLTEAVDMATEMSLHAEDEGVIEDLCALNSVLGASPKNEIRKQTLDTIVQVAYALGMQRGIKLTIVPLED